MRGRGLDIPKVSLLLKKNQLQEKVEKVPLILFLPPTSLEHFSHPEDDFRL